MPSMFASLGCGTSGLCAALRMQLSGQQVAMAIAGAVSCILAIAVALVTSTWGSDLRRRLRQIAVVWTCFSALAALGWKIPGAIYANQVARARAAVCARFDKLRGDSASPGAEEHARQDPGEAGMRSSRMGESFRGNETPFFLKESSNAREDARELARRLGREVARVEVEHVLEGVAHEAAHGVLLHRRDEESSSSRY